MDNINKGNGFKPLPLSHGGLSDGQRNSSVAVNKTLPKQTPRNNQPHLNNPLTFWARNIRPIHIEPFMKGLAVGWTIPVLEQAVGNNSTIVGDRKLNEACNVFKIKLEALANEDVPEFIKDASKIFTKIDFENTTCVANFLVDLSNKCADFKKTVHPRDARAADKLDLKVDKLIKTVTKHLSVEPPQRFSPPFFDSSAQSGISTDANFETVDIPSSLETPKSGEEPTWEGEPIPSAKPNTGTIETQEPGTIERPEEDTVSALLNTIVDESARLSPEQHRDFLTDESETFPKKLLEPSPTTAVSNEPEIDPKVESQNKIVRHVSTATQTKDKKSKNIQTDRISDELCTRDIDDESLKSSVKSAETQASNDRNKVEKLLESVNSLTNRQKQLKRTNKKKEKSLNAARMELSISKEQIDSLQKEAQEKQQALDKTKEALREQSEENTDLKDRLAEASNRAGSMESTITKLNNELDTVKADNSSSKEQIDSLQKEAQEKQQDLDKTKEALNDTEEKLREQSEENADLKDQLAEASNRADSLESENDELKDKLNRLMNLVSSQGIQLDELTETKNKLELTEAENNTLEHKLATQEKEHTSIIDDIKEKLTQERMLFDEQKEELNNRLSKEIEKQSNIGNELETTRSELGIQINLRAEAEDRLKQLELDMLDDIKRLKCDLDRSKENSGKLQSIISDKEREISGLSLKLEEQSNQAKILEKKRKVVSSENIDLKRQLNLQENKVADAEYKANQHHKQIKHERSQHLAALDQVKKDSKELEDELDNAISDLKKVRAEKYQEGCKFAAKKDEYKEKLAELEDKIKVMNKQLEEAYTANTVAQGQVTEINGKMVELEKERDQLRSSIGRQKYMMNFEHSHDPTAKMVSNHSDFNEDLEPGKLGHHHGDLEVSAIEQELLAANKKIQELESDANTLKIEIADNQATKNKLGLVEKQLAEKQAALSRLVGKNNSDILDHYLNEMLRAMAERDDLAGKHEIEMSAAVKKARSDLILDDNTLGMYKEKSRMAEKLLAEKAARIESDRLLNEKTKEVEILKRKLGK